MIFFRRDSRLGIVISDRLELIAKVHLDDLLHLLVEFSQALLDLAGLRPDPSINRVVFVVSEVHQTGKALTQSRGIDYREIDPTGWTCRQEPENDAVHRAGRSNRRPATG